MKRVARHRKETAAGPRSPLLAACTLDKLHIGVVAPWQPLRGGILAAASYLLI